MGSGDDLLALLPEPEHWDEALRLLRLRTGMNREQFADALSRRLGKRVWRPNVSHYEIGDRQPLAEILLAALLLARDAEMEGEVDPVRDQIERLQELLEVEQSRRRLPLDWAERVYEEPAEETLTVVDAAKQYNVTRQAIYDWGRAGRVKGYQWLGAARVSVADLEQELKRNVKQRPKRNTRVVRKAAAR